MKTKDMKTILLIALFSICTSVNAQIEKIWETNHTVGKDGLEVFFYKQDSVGNHFTGGVIGLTFFVSKFNSSGVHQWTVSDNRLIDKSPHVNYDTQQIEASRVSDIAFKEGRLYISGSKKYPTSSNFNFILVLNTDGDSIAFCNVLKEDVFHSTSWDASGQRPLLQILDSQLYLFTSLHNWTSAPGSENINVFKYDKDLNLLKNMMFDGTLSASRDQITDVIQNVFSFTIFSSSSYNPHLIQIDSALNLNWQTFYRKSNTTGNKAISLMRRDSVFYTAANMKDLNRNGYFLVQLRPYSFNGTPLDSLELFFDSTSSDSSTDATIDNRGNIYITGVSKDNGVKKVFLFKIGTDSTVEKILVGNSPLDKIIIKSDDCRLYLSFIDSLGTGTVLKLIRLDENLNILSEEHYHTGKSKIFSLATKDNELHLLSTGKNMLTDTLSLKNLADTVVIAEPIVFTTLPTNPRSIGLNWQISGGLNDTVVIYKSTDNENWQVLKSLPSSLITFTDSNLNPSTRYYYSLIVRWKEENSCNQLFVSDSTPFNTGINPVKNQYFRIYPNPGYSEIHIQGTENIEEIEMITVTGKTIRTYHHQENISIKDLIPGIYFIRINRTSTYKIIKL